MQGLGTNLFVGLLNVLLFGRICLHRDASVANLVSCPFERFLKFAGYVDLFVPISGGK